MIELRGTARKPHDCGKIFDTARKIIQITVQYHDEIVESFIRVTNIVGLLVPGTYDLCLVCQEEYNTFFCFQGSFILEPQLGCRRTNSNLHSRAFVERAPDVSKYRSNKQAKL